MRVNDTILGLLLIALAVAMVYLTRDYPTMAGQGYGPALFPRVLAGGLALCGIAITLRGVRTLGSEPWLIRDTWTYDPQARRNVLLILAALIFFLLTAHTLGFLASSMIILLTLFVAYGVNLWLAPALAVVVTAVVFYAFTIQLRVPLPRGLLEPLVGM